MSSMLKVLEEKAGGPAAAARMLGVPYTSSYAAYASGKRTVPRYIQNAVEALVLLPDDQFRDLAKGRNITPSQRRPWVVLMPGPKGAISPNGVSNSGSRYASEPEAFEWAKKLRDAGFEGARPVFRPNGVRLQNEPPLDDFDEA